MAMEVLPLFVKILFLSLEMVIVYEEGEGEVGGELAMEEGF